MNTSRVVQAHVSDGALKARISLWNVKLTAGIHPAGQAIQRKSAGGVEAFRVPLRQKAGGLPLPSECARRWRPHSARTFQTCASTSDMN